MQQLLTYHTSFSKDSYSIFSNKIQVGKLYKKEWLGSVIESAIDGHKYRFVLSGFFKLTVSVVDNTTRKTIGTVIMDSFKFSPAALLTLANNKQYAWTSKGMFSYKWKWQDPSNMLTIISSNEPLDLLKQNGTISVMEKDDQQELLVALGIHLRNVIRRKTILTRAIGVIIAILLLMQFLIR